MPEGPEIRRAADRVENVLQNRVVEAVAFGLPALRRFEQRLTDRRVTGVETRGKAMLTHFDNDLTLYSHNQLYGRWYTTKRPGMPSTGRQLRVALHTATHSALLYSASDIAVLTPGQLAKHPFLSRLGPDILDPDLTEDAIVARLLGPDFNNRALGSLYLDQAFLAGNGNYLRSEILFAAGVHPLRKPSELDGKARKKLARETLKISRRSYRTGGLTVPRSLARQLKYAGAGFERHRFFVYGRDHLPCRCCGSTIERGQMGSRAIFYCASCQSS